jgi:hypothetical protein
MNERIKALAVEADFALYEDGNFRSEPGQWINEELEKFAELIIQECIDLALEWAGGFDGYPRNDVNIVIDEIKKHFESQP